MRASVPPRVTPSGDPEVPVWRGRTTASARTPTSAQPSSPSAPRRAPAGWTARDRGEPGGVGYEHDHNFIVYRKATGECVGWKCLCKSTDNATLPPEFEDIKASE